MSSKVFAVNASDNFAVYIAGTQKSRLSTFTTVLPAEGVDLNGRYGVGGSGNLFDAAYQLPWRNWNLLWHHIYANKSFYTVGIVPAGTEATFPNLQTLYDADVPIITDLINTHGLTGWIWEVANESNAVGGPQFTPADYATYYEMYRSLIVGLDPTAKLMICGILNMVPWKVWLDDTGITPDIWNIHPYHDPLSSTGTIEYIQDFRAYRPDGRPIWITEFSAGSNTPASIAQIIQYLYEVCGWLHQNWESNQIIRWFWFTVFAGGLGGKNGLFTTNPYGANTITSVGQAYYYMRNQLG